jgi:hypothetical protein
MYSRKTIGILSIFIFEYFSCFKTSISEFEIRTILRFFKPFLFILPKRFVEPY